MRVTASNLDEVVARLNLAAFLSIDTETTGLSEEDRPFAFIIGDAETEFYFDKRSITLSPFQLEKVQNILSTTGKVWFLQNAKFDMRMLSHLGLTIYGKIYDLTVMARLLRNDHMAYSLEHQAARHGMRKGADFIKKYIADNDLYETRRDFFGVSTKQPRYDRVPIDVMEEYATMDARITYDLGIRYLADIEGTPSMKVLENEAKLIKVCYNMERHGLLLNRQYTIQARAHELEIVEAKRVEYKNTTGVDYVNSAKSVEKWTERHGVILPRTDKGNPTLTDDVIEDILAQENIPAPVSQGLLLIQEIRHYEKRIGTYYEGYLNAIDRNGVVHPSMWQAGTKTGRFSYSDPNLQNIPKEKKSVEPYVVRGCFQPRVGTVYVSFDYSQMEYRLMAAYANEQEIIRRVMEGEDFHEVAAELFGVERDPAKTLNFAVLYGAGDPKLAGMLGVSLKEAQRLKLKYFMALSRVETLVDKIKATGRARGYVTNWFGRNLYSDPNHVYALPNHLIQSGGADVVKLAMVRIAEQYPNIPMVLQVHDQLVFEVRPDQYADLPGILSIMENSFPSMNGMSLKVDVEWSAKSLAVRDMIKGMPSGRVGEEPTQQTEG